jgi:hypothetical protein
MRYRKKPVVIDAVQWNGVNNQEIEDFAKTAIEVHGEEKLKIETLEGVMTAIPGDWIIKGVKGEFYPCKPDIFEATYELVESWGA